MDASLLRVGVIGVGHLGQHHARVYAEMAECRLVGVYDVDARQAQRVAERHGTRVMADVDELLAQVDAVSIAVPTEHHYALAIACLERGVHVLVEKPMATTLDQADRINALAAEQGAIVQVGHIERFNAAVVQLARLIDGPAFIESNRLSPFPERSTDIDVVLDIMIHDIDIILSLVKAPVTQLDAVGIPVITSKVDIANTRLEFESGCIANVTASRVSLKHERKLRIFQPRKYLSLDYREQTLQVVEVQHPERRHDFPEQRPSIHPYQVAIEKEEPLKAELRAFVQCARTGSRPEVSGQDGRNALAVAFNILDAIRIAPLGKEYSD